jgi:hypothetical protein
MPVGTPLLVGGAFHEAQELFFKQKRDHGIEVECDKLQAYALQILSDKLTEEELVVMLDEERDEVIEAAKKKLKSMVGVFHSDFAPTITDIEFIEEKVVIEPKAKDMPPIWCIMDLTTPGVIHDSKTGSKKWTQSDLDLDGQLSAYALAYKVRTGSVPDRIFLDNFVATKTQTKWHQLSTTRENADIIVFLRKVRYVWKAIHQGIFPPPYKGWWCTKKYCGYAWAGKCDYYPENR